ncbi:MAG: S9 family peptidase [Candidatus Heimdallarchaeota archaeon]|nr:S9 family peptidase [Candidatus Heimdallarchaeota archaeon]
MIELEKISKIPSIDGLKIDKYGKSILYISNKSGSPQLYRKCIENNSEPSMISFGEEYVSNFVLSPDEEQILYKKDSKGDEISHLYLTDLKNMNRKQISKDAYRTFPVIWNPSGKSVIRSVITADGCGIEEINIESLDSQILFISPTPYLSLAFSSDGKRLAATHMQSMVNSQILIIDWENKKVEHNISFSDNSSEKLPSWSPDGEKLAVLSNSKGQLQVIIYYIDSKITKCLTLNQETEVFPDSGETLWNPDSSSVYYIISKHSQTQIIEQCINNGNSTTVPFPKGLVTEPDLSKDGRFLAIKHSAINFPTEIYCYNLETNKMEEFSTLSDEQSLVDLPKVQSVWYESYDGKRIHAWYMPSTDRTSKRGVVLVHGGPAWQHFDSFETGLEVVALSLSGLSVIAPNIRGSTGYGKEFQESNIGDIGGADLEDVVYAAQTLKELLGSDNSKIAIMGPSYGGYLSLLALTKKAKIFDAGVAISPIVDLSEMYRSSDRAYRMFLETYLGGTLDEKEELYIERSPSTYVENILSPVIIVASTQDSRTPFEPVADFISKLEKQNHTHELIKIEEAGHNSILAKIDVKTYLLKTVISKLNDYLI